MYWWTDCKWYGIQNFVTISTLNESKKKIKTWKDVYILEGNSNNDTSKLVCIMAYGAYALTALDNGIFFQWGFFFGIKNKNSTGIYIP